jgi:hypothetical protein
MILLVTCLLFIHQNTEAQVYHFKPKYYCQSIYGHEYDQLTFDSIKVFRQGAFVIDLNNKTITDPTEYEIISITDVVSNGTQLIIKAKRVKESYQLWHQYLMDVQDTNVIYFQEQETLKGSTRDTFYSTYSNDLGRFYFSKSFHQKFVTAEKEKLFVYSTNRVSMKDGYITWQEGKKEKKQKTEPVIRQFKVTEIKRESSSETPGVTYYCAEGDVPYRFFYGYGFINNEYTNKKQWTEVAMITWVKDGVETTIMLK